MSFIFDIRFALILSITLNFVSALSPLLSAFINQRGSYKLKKLELFFQFKADAYQAFLDIASQFPDCRNDELLLKLNTALNHAMLLSCEDTRSKLAIYESCLMQESIAPDVLAKAYRDAILAMQKELKNKD